MEEIKEDKLEKLKARLSEATDFPALSRAVSLVSQKAAKLHDITIGDLTSDVLSDVSITNKLLKVVNTFAYATTHSAGKISTISRAIFVAGFDKIKSIALSLLLFENLKDGASAAYLKEDILKAFISGVIAREMSKNMGHLDPEEIFIYSVFHQLGKLLVTFLLPLETMEIRKLIAKGGFKEKQAAMSVLGKSYEEIGMEVATQWGYAHEMIQTMKSITRKKVDPPLGDLATKHTLICFSHDLGSIVFNSNGKLKEDIYTLIKRYKCCFDFSADKLVQIIHTSLAELNEYADNYDNSSQFDRILERLEKVVEVLRADESLCMTYSTKVVAGENNEEEDVEEEGEEGLQELGEMDDESWLSTVAAQAVETAMPLDAQAIMARGIEDISSALSLNMSFNELLLKVLHIMHEAIGFTRVLFCVKNTKESVMEGRYGFGKDIDTILKGFKFTLGSPTDIFNLALFKDSDIIIDDREDPRIAPHIPDWYKELIDARTFIVMPLVVNSKRIGIIYGDKPAAGDINLPENIVNSLRILRDHLITCIKNAYRR